MKEKILSFVNLKRYFRGEPCSFLEFFMATILSNIICTGISIFGEIMILRYLEFPLPFFTGLILPKILWIVTLIQYFRHSKHLFENHFFKIFLVLTIIPFTFQRIYFSLPIYVFGSAFGIFALLMGMISAI